MNRHLRQREIKLRKNFLPSFILTLLLWAILLTVVYLNDPTTPGVVPLFFVILPIVLFFTFSLLFSNKRRGVIATFVLTIFLLLRYFGVGNIVNLSLLILLGVTVEIYLAKKA